MREIGTVRWTNQHGSGETTFYVHDYVNTNWDGEYVPYGRIRALSVYDKAHGRCQWTNKESKILTNLALTVSGQTVKIIQSQGEMKESHLFDRTQTVYPEEIIAGYFSVGWKGEEVWVRIPKGLKKKIKKFFKKNVDPKVYQIPQTRCECYGGPNGFPYCENCGSIA